MPAVLVYTMVSLHHGDTITLHLQNVKRFALQILLFGVYNKKAVPHLAELHNKGLI